MFLNMLAIYRGLRSSEVRMTWWSMAGPGYYHGILSTEYLSLLPVVTMCRKTFY